MSSIAEYRRVLEIEGRLDALHARMVEVERMLNTAMARCTELEVRLDTPRLSPTNNTQRRA